MTLIAEPVVRQGAELGEGAFWHAPDQRLYWVDITGKTVFVYDPATGKNRAIPVGSDVGTIVPRKSGGAIVALKDGFAAVNLETGAVKMLAKVEADLPHNRFNDGKCDPAGRFWAGSLDYDLKKGAGALYCMDTKLHVRKVIPDVTCSNGLVWTRDQKTFYYIDSGASCIAAYDYDNATGRIENRRVVVMVKPEEAFLDGMAIDANDNVWVAIWHRGQVRCWDPRTGKLIEMIEVPGAKLTTSCSFAGPNLDEMYITSASCGLSESEKAEQPLAGALFRVKPGVKGVPGFAFGG
jgi:sugar lactone lactonase YvrE